MKKSTLRLLGQLLQVKADVWESEQQAGIEEWSSKLRLIDKVKHEIEENARGFKKSRLPYHLAGEFLIKDKNFKLPYSELHKRITEILLSKEDDP